MGPCIVLDTIRIAAQISARQQQTSMKSLHQQHICPPSLFLQQCTLYLHQLVSPLHINQIFQSLLYLLQLLQGQVYTHSLTHLLYIYQPFQGLSYFLQGLVCTHTPYLLQLTQGLGSQYVHWDLSYCDRIVII